MTDSEATPVPGQPGAGRPTATKDELLALLGEGDVAPPVASMRDALRSSRETTLRLARGRPEALTRTYRGRLAEARAQRVPTVGIPGLLSALEQCAHEHVWGFTMRDNTMVYIGFADPDFRTLLGVVIIARRGAERVIAG